MIHTPHALIGAQGSGYDYVLARDGVYVQSQNHRLTARIRIAPATIRGLNPTSPLLRLSHGPIPVALLELGISAMLATPRRETYFGIGWNPANDAYRLIFPEQTGTATRLHYQVTPDLVAEFHSHGVSQAFFSATDDADEQGFRIYGVVGRLDNAKPTLTARVGVYGHFSGFQWTDAFTALPRQFQLRPYPTNPKDQP